MHWGVVLQNTSGATINTLTLDFDAVMNRNPSTTVNSYALSYQVSTANVASGTGQSGAGTFNNLTGTWLTSSLGFSTPTSGTGAPGTQAAISPMHKIADVSGDLTGLNWQNNQYLYIRFADGDEGGADALAGVDNFQITAPSGNQTPVNTVPGAQTANLNSPLAFNTANGNLISIADDSAALTLTLTSTNGNLTLSSLTGLTGGGNGTNSLSYAGTAIDLNNALQGLTYTSATLGADTLVVTTSDGTLSDSDNIAITTYNMTSLAAGDIALVHYDTNASPDNFSFVVLKTLNAGTRFYISDNEIALDGDSSFVDTGEAEALFFVNDGQTIPAGTVIKLPSDASATTTAYTWAGGGGLGNTNEELYFYTGPNATTPTQFIYGVAIGSSASARPAGLTTGTTFIAPQGVAARYKLTGELYNASQSLLLASIGDTANNWETLTAGTATNANDWTFTVATGPEANVQGNSVDIASGDTTPGTGDHTDFGSALVGSAAVDRTFTLQNNGTTDITLSGTPDAVAISGGSNFSILAQPASTTIAPGTSVTFVVRFNPATVGTQTATITIANNDANEGTYTFDVAGNVTSSVASTTTTLGSITPATLTVGSSVNFSGTIVAGSGSALPTGTIEIRDGGAGGTLLASTMIIGGSGVNGTFSIDTTSVPVGTYNNIQAFYIPGAGFTASNSGVFGTALTVNPVVVSVGDIAFTAVHADSTAPAADFFEFVALRDMPAGTTIYFFDSPFNGTAFSAGESGMRWVAQTAVTAGAKFSWSSAPDGNAVPNTPEWTAINPQTGLAESSASFGLSTSGESIHALYNPTFGGSGALTGTAIAAVYFGEVPATLPSDIVLGENAVSIGNSDNGQYDPTVGGSIESGTAAQVRTSVNTAANWLISETALSPPGTAATFSISNAPEINIQGSGNNIADGDNTPSTADGTDFGAAVQGGSAIDRTFTIQNNGTQPLTLSGGPNFVSVSGGSNFSILTQPASSTIAGGASATFVVRMTPTTIATQTATVTVTSDDADEGTYTFDVTSVVTASAAATTTAIATINPLTAAAGDSIAFTGSVVADTGTATPIGTIEIRNGGAGGTLLASTTTITGPGATGTFSIVSTNVPAGTYNSIQAFFVPGAGFQASNSGVFGNTLDVAASLAYVNYSTSGSTYSQNFNTLINTTGPTLEGNGPFHLADSQFSTSPISGWYFSKHAGTGSNATFRVDNGGLNTGAIYSYGATSQTERALGSVSSGGVASRFGTIICNTSSGTLDTITITFDGEQWRNGVGSSSAANTLSFQYAAGIAPGATIDNATFVSDNGLELRRSDHDGYGHRGSCRWKRRGSHCRHHQNHQRHQLGAGHGPDSALERHR